MAEALAYFDTSLIAPLYRSESLTDVAEALQQQFRPAISLLTEVELASTLARWVRMGELTQEQAADIDRVFAEDLRLGAFERAELCERHYWRARNWLQRRNNSLRTLDALHLAVAAEQGLAHHHRRPTAAQRRPVSGMQKPPGRTDTLFT